MQIQVSVTGQVKLNVPGLQALSQSISERKVFGPYLASLANNVTNGSDESYVGITTVAASGNATLNLQAFKDLVNQTGVSLARVKAYMIWLLSTADDSVNGTLCTGVTINGTGGTNLAVLPGITNTTLGNGEAICWGTPSATGAAISATTCNIYIANNDASHAAAVLIVAIGGTT